MIRVKARKALRDFTLDVDIEAPEGETIVLMGSNGAGKTTVLNLAAGLTRPDDGVISLDGRTFFDPARGIDEPPETRNVGYVFQHYALFPHMTVFDNVAFGPRMRKRPRMAVEARAREELEALGMWDLKDVRASRLSGGQRQKVALARAFAADPALLLLDEPLSALDVASHLAVRDTLRERIKRLRIPAIIVLHSSRDLLALGDRAFVMDRGQVVRSGPPAEVLKAVPD